MDEIWQECLFPVMLGSNTLCHACVRRMEKNLGLGSTVLTGKRALTLRFWPKIRLVAAPPTLPDDILLSILQDMNDESGLRVPLLVLCDLAYEGFVERNRAVLESKFVLRRGEDLIGEEVRS